MSVEVDWFIRDRVILLRFNGNVTIRDVKEINRELVRCFHRTDASQVHILLDTRNVKHFPRNIDEIRQISTAHKYPQMGWLISFGGNAAVLSFIENLVAQILGLRYRRVPSMEHALYFLKQVDSTLVEIPPRD